MQRHRISLPPSCWPDNLRDRFGRHPLTAAQRTRLQRGLGRWLKISMELGVEAHDVTQKTWSERTGGLPRAIRNDLRQALAIAFPEAAASLYVEERECAPRADPRVALGAVIARNLERFPDNWRAAAAPMLHVSEGGIGDGILVQAWAPSTIKRRLEAAAQHFDYCRRQGFEIDIAPSSVRAILREDQARVSGGKRRIGGVAVDMMSLLGIASAVWPDRNWGWLKTTRDRVTKLANSCGSRNAARAVNAAELRAAGQQLLDRADAAHVLARNRREFVKAHTAARTALTIILLAEAPIRITNCAELELESSLLGNLAGLVLEAESTKEGARDQRAFSMTLVEAIGRYIRMHRAVIAVPGEPRLLVGDKGGPILGTELSKCMGDFTEPIFGVRVTPHAIRHSVANMIVASAPEEAALASIILNHRTDSITSIYHQRADQVIASRRLGAATDEEARALSAHTTPTRRSLMATKRCELSSRKRVRARVPVRAYSGEGTSSKKPVET